VRKLVFILAAIVVAGVLAVVVVKFQKKELAIEEVLPQEAQLYAYFDNVEGNLNHLGRSQLWQSMSQIDYNRLAEQGLVDPQQLMLFQGIQSKLSDPQAQLILNKLFGKEFAVIVYPISIKISDLSNPAVLTTSTFMDDALSNLLIVSRIPADVQVAEFFSGLFQDFGGDTKKETLNYKDFTIQTVFFPQANLRLSYVRMKDLLVITVGERAAQKCIDVFKKERPSLAQDAQFTQAMKRSVKDRELFLYWDMEIFLSFMKDQVEALSSLVTQQAQETDAAQVTEQLNQAFAAVAGFKTFTLSGHFDSLSKLQFNMFMDRTKLSPELASYYTCEATLNKTLKLVPPGVMGYQWNSCFHLEQYWDQVLKEFAKKQADGGGGNISEQVQQIEATLGLSIENDVLPAFGDEFGGYLADISVGGPFPIPKFLFFVEVKDKNKTDKILSLLTRTPLLAFQQEEYADVTINYINPLLGGEDIQPGYAYLENYLLLAINRKVLKDSIDAYTGKAPSLSADPAFKEIDDGLTQENLNVFYVRMAAFANKLEDMIEWANLWAESQQKQREAFQAGSQQRLDIVLADIKRLQEDIQEMEKEKSSVTVQVTGTQLQAEEDPTSIEAVGLLEQSLETKKKDLQASQDQKAELEELIGSYEETGLSSQKRQLLLESLVYPFLSGLNSINAFAGRTTIEGDVFESTLLFMVRP